MVGLLWGGVDESEITRERLVELPYVIVGGSKHPLAGRKGVRLTELCEYDWIAPNLGTARRATYDKMVAAMPKSPNAAIHASALATLRLLIAKSERLAVLTKFEFDQEFGMGGFALIDVEPIVSNHHLGMVWRSNWLPTNMHKHFLDLMRIKTKNF